MFCRIRGSRAPRRASSRSAPSNSSWMPPTSGRSELSYVEIPASPPRLILPPNTSIPKKMCRIMRHSIYRFHLLRRWLRPCRRQAPAGSVGDSCDDAMAEIIIGSYNTEALCTQRPWRSGGDVEIATLCRVDWFNKRRRVGPIGYVSPTEFASDYYAKQQSPALQVGLSQPSLRQTWSDLNRSLRRSGGYAPSRCRDRFISSPRTYDRSRVAIVRHTFKRSVTAGLSAPAAG